MATLNIRKLPDEVHRRLRLRAARAGRSMEAEARSILTEALAPEPPHYGASELQDLVQALYGGDLPTGVVDELIAERRREAHDE